MRRLSVFLALSACVMLSGFTDRPRDPWVFRCVLDKQPRMVVIALHEHLWVAYDATTCSLYKAWDGDVMFQGAVYNDVHGPQPESRGDAYVTGPHHGLLSIKQSDRDLKLTWRGYRYEDEGVALLYDVTLEDGSTVRITERPRVQRTVDGIYQLMRFFSSDDYPSSVSMRISRTANGRLESTDNIPIILPSGGAAILSTRLHKSAEESP